MICLSPGVTAQRLLDSVASVQYLSIDDAVALMIGCVSIIKKERKAKSICLGLGVHLILVITRGLSAILLQSSWELSWIPLNLKHSYQKQRI